ncbi:unnamed protein product [Dracunculus medinensis]|uniref:Pre-SET domain-containing protein n=1 Tax=Dracunculus medinensis TaxID=318479 RepID=A0A0N4UQ92_DRAME|nr:unnamed protein product [Dracunculus medinensis]
MNVIVAPKWDCDLEKQKQKELEEDKDKCGTRNSTTFASEGDSSFLFHRRKNGRDQEQIAAEIAKDLMKYKTYNEHFKKAKKCGCGLQTCRKKNGDFDVVEFNCDFRKN